MSDNNLPLYYKVLKQFLEVLGKRTRKNSERAADARQKLSRLSLAQFRELSTDVYDELKRRIDENNGEPDFLLPKSTFHPNRNKARSQLASLPQVRFKDLVSDILFEIERRDLHISPEEQTQTSPTRSTTSSHKSIPDQVVDNEPSPSRSDHNDEAYNASQIGLQSKTVVPTKANLTWSSDEEEEDDLNKEDEIPSNDLQQENESLKSKIASLTREIADLHTHKQSLVSQIDSLQSEKKNWHTESPSKEVDSLKASNAALRLEIQALKNSTSKDILRSNTLHSRERSLGTSFDKQPEFDASNTNFRKQLESFYDKLDQINEQNPPTKASSNEVANLKKEVLVWQKRYEKARSNAFSEALVASPLTGNDLKSFVSPSGIISIKLVADLQALVESFMLYINQQDFDADLLFEKISKISIVANEIAVQGDNGVLNSNENSVCLRESISHALTATRYLALYSTVLPKIVIERALSEICFTLCDLITVSKLHPDSASSQSADTSLIVPQTTTATTAKNDTFDVRPLKIANKVKEASPEVATRNSNGNGDILPKSMTSEYQTKNSPIKNQFGSPLSTNGSVKSLASKFNSPEREKTSPRTSGSNKSSPKARGILDRVKQFESPPQQAIGSGSPVRKHNKSADLDEGKQLSEPFELNKETSEEPRQVGLLGGLAAGGAVTAAATAAATTQAPAASKPKGIFQSLKDRFTADKHEDASDGSDNERAETSIEKNSSTAETTPNKDEQPYDVVDSPSKKETPFLRNNSEPVQFSSSASDVTDATIQNEASKEPVESPVRNPVQIESPFRESPLKESPLKESPVKESPIKVTSPVKLVQSPAVESPVSRSVESPVSKSSQKSPFLSAPVESPTTTVKVPVKQKNVGFASPEQEEDSEDYSDEEDEDSDEAEARQRQEYRKSMAAATFNIDLFDVDDPDNTLTQVLLYLEHQTVQVISTIQSLLSAIKKPDATRGELRDKSKAITIVISQMSEATNVSMNQTRNFQLKEHGSWVVASLEDCNHRMNILCRPNADKNDDDFADKNFKQRLAGISFDIAKCTKELVKTVEEASLKEEIQNLNARLSNGDDLT